MVSNRLVQIIVYRLLHVMGHPPKVLTLCFMISGLWNLGSLGHLAEPATLLAFSMATEGSKPCSPDQSTMSTKVFIEAVVFIVRFCSLNCQPYSCGLGQVKGGCDLPKGSTRKHLLGS